MNFLEASELLYEGKAKKIRQTCWQANTYVYLDFEEIKISDGEQLNIHNVRATDWVVVE